MRALRTVVLLVILAALPLSVASLSTADDTTITNVTVPTITGATRYPMTLTAHVGTWSVTPTSYRFRWYRDGQAIGGATGRIHRIGAGDVGHRLSVHVQARRDGYSSTVAWSVRTAKIAHRVPVKARVYYRIATKGKITTSVSTFAAQAAQTYADARGWRGAGVEFHRVSKGGSFTLWLVQASLVPSFSGGCSSQWSCRVGNNVVINQDRWKYASTAWNKAKGSLRDYRHMVIDHETGHWLGWSHRQCPGKGQKAAVMQQQSKGLGGCLFNPWPRGFELNPPRFRAKSSSASATTSGSVFGPAGPGGAGVDVE